LNKQHYRIRYPSNQIEQKLQNLLECEDLINYLNSNHNNNKSLTDNKIDRHMPIKYTFNVKHDDIDINEDDIDCELNTIRRNACSRLKFDDFNETLLKIA
jgi:hypothetical protein